MRGIYVDQNGTLQRDSTGFPRFKLRSQRFPFLVAITTLGVLSFLTNPANNIEMNTSAIFPSLSSLFNKNSGKNGRTKTTNPKRNKVGTINLSWFGFEMDVYESSIIENLRKPSTHIEKMTNFLFFSLSTRTRDGIYVHALQKKIQLCNFDEWDDLRICETISDTFCHEMKVFSVRNRPFTAFRMIIYTLLLNTVLHAFFFVKVYSNWSILIFSDPPVLQDYIYSTFYLYPFLEILEKVIAKGYSHGTDNTTISLYYYTNVAFFFFIGKVCQILVQRIIYDRRSSEGSRMGTYAAALGYQMSFQKQMKNIIIFRLWQVNMEFDASSILLGHTVMGVFSILGGMYDGTDAFGELLLWIFGALAGKELGTIHTHHYGNV